MAAYIEKRTIEITKTPGRTGQVKAITLRRGENDATEIQGVVKNNGAIFNVSGYTVKFIAMLPNGDYAEIPGTISNAAQGTISAVVTNNLTAVEGNITIAYFELSKGTTVLTTDAIPIWVERDVDITTGQAGNYQNHIDSLVKQLDEYIRDAAQAAQAAKDANEAATKANTATTNANSATKKANDAAKAAGDIADDLQEKLDSGYFKGAKGDKGDKGDKGEPGSVTNLASHERVQMFYDYYVLKQQSVTPIIYVYLLGGDELKFSPKPITAHDRPLTASWQIKDTDPAFGSNTAIPWYTDYRTAITSITIEDIIIPKTMQRLFYGLSEIRNLDALAMIDVSNSDNLYGTFNGVSKVSDYSGLRNWNISNMRTIGYAFYNNTSMDSVEYFKNWDTSSVDSMESTFFNCNKVNDFTPINGWNVSKVVSHNSCFTGTTGTRPSWGVNW